MPPSAEELRVEGNEHHKAGRYAEAVQAYTAAIDVAGPSHDDLHLLLSNRAASYNAVQDSEAALQDARQAMELAPHFPKAYHRCAVALLDLGRPEEALAVCVAGVRRCPAPEGAGPHLLAQQLHTAVLACLQRAAGRGYQALQRYRAAHPPPAPPTPTPGLPVVSPEEEGQPLEVEEAEDWAPAEGEADPGDGPAKRQPSDSPLAGESPRKRLRATTVGPAGAGRWGPLGRDLMAGRPTVRALCTCGHCGGLLRQPCTLACGHSLCQACLADLAQWVDTPPPRCPACRTALRGAEFHRGLCRQLRDLVGAMFETEARMAEVMAGDGRTEPDRLKALLDTPLPDHVAALVQCHRAEQLLPTSLAEALRCLQEALTLDSRLPRTYLALHRAWLAHHKPVLALQALIQGFVCAWPAQASEGPRGFAHSASLLLADPALLAADAAECLRLFGADFVCGDPEGDVIPLPTACPPLRHRFDRNLCLSKLECPICLNIFCDPVTAHCGHTFCRNCLSRTLDHDNHCPFCRALLPSFLSQAHCTNHVLQGVIELHYGAELRERQAQLAAEQQMDNLAEFPIFVCMVALPGSNYPLHIFEPRYRLMIRRAWESTKRIGMCVHTSDGFAPVGCVLELSDLRMLPDGRCTLQTYGTRRFRVLERGMKDGYNVGRIEWFDDDPEREAELNEDGSTDALIEAVRGTFSRVPPRVYSVAVAQMGPLPADDSLRSFWYARLISDDSQRFLLQFLMLRTIRDRYEALQDQLQQVALP